jgi:hypothetical protein
MGCLCDDCEDAIEGMTQEQLDEDYRNHHGRCEGCTYDGPDGHCHLCHESMPDADLLEHLRIMHPAAYGNGPETWPDVGPVIVDGAPETEDFAPHRKPGGTG